MRTRLTDLIGIEVPIVQAPMAGCNGADLVVAVAQAGGLGSLPTALFDAAGIGEEMRSIRDRTSAPINLNFFCHTEPEVDAARMERWLGSLAAYYAELGIEPPRGIESGGRSTFDAAMCEIVEELRPEVVSFQFGLPDESLVTRVKATGAVVFSTATTAAEARWLAERGCDVVVAQGCEAGGHRGTFLGADVSSQAGTMALVPQVVDAVEVPVVAAGGIGDGRSVAAAMVLGADGVQIGTGFLRCPEATTSALHRAALAAATDDTTALTNVFTGRPARHRQSNRRRDGADVAGRSRLPPRCARGRPPSGGRRARGHQRFLAAVVGSGRRSRSRHPCWRPGPRTDHRCGRTTRRGARPDLTIKA